jgi:CP family cyanate transporter-like MFS transporter
MGIATEEPLPARRRLNDRALLLIGVALVGLNLRLTVSSLPPIFLTLQHRWHLSGSAVTLLATTPLICFGLFSYPVARVANRFGQEKVVQWALGAIAVGLLARSLGKAWLFPGTVVSAGAIAFLNALMPSIMKRRYPTSFGPLLSVQMVSLTIGGIASTSLTVPILHASNSLTLAMMIWMVPAVVAVIVWHPQTRRAESIALTRVTAVALSPPLTRRPLAWQIAAFMGLQSLTGHGMGAWLPTIFQDRGLSSSHAGFVAAATSVGSLAAALVVPLLAHGSARQARLVVISTAGTIGGMLAIFFGPTAGALVWTILLGLAQGASFSLALSIVIARSENALVAAAMSSMAQGFGYLLAATGPFSLGMLHDVTGNWNVAGLGIVGATVIQGCFGLMAARDRLLSERPNAQGGADSDAMTPVPATAATTTSSAELP